MAEITLSRAAATGSLAQLRGLLKAGAKVTATNSMGTTPLMWACARGDVHVVRELLDYGADANAANHAGLTPLILAAGGGFPGIVKLLLQHGADVRVKAASGETALSRAQQSHNTYVISLVKAAINQAEMAAEAVVVTA